MWLALLPLFLQILTQLPALIETAEHAFSGKPGSGKAKKKFVESIIHTGIDTYQAAAPAKIKLEAGDIGVLKTSVSTMIDSTVAAINAVQETEEKDVSFLNEEESHV